MSIPIHTNIEQTATALSGRNWLMVEMLYAAPPAVESPAGRIFAHNLRSRLTELARIDPQSGVLFLCSHADIVPMLTPYLQPFPRLLTAAVVVNPARYTGEPGDTPHRLEWDTPDLWCRYVTTDRWARLEYALQVGARLAGENNYGWLVMPALDAVFGEGLFSRLGGMSESHARRQTLAAVSPVTPHQHHAVSGVDIDLAIIGAMNAAFGRDASLAMKLFFERVQGFWGKMALLPFALCAPILAHASMEVWEDDLEIDSVLRAHGYGVRARWMENPRLYHQSPPVFTRADLKRVIERTLHYSLHIPSEGIGGSALTMPLSLPLRLRRRIDARFDRDHALAETIIAECRAEIADRVAHYGASWVDWGAYRCVARPGDPFVEVWGRDE